MTIYFDYLEDALDELIAQFCALFVLQNAIAHWSFGPKAEWLSLYR